MAEKPDPTSLADSPSPLTEGYLTARQAAERMELPVEAVRALCKDGSLSGAERRQGRWYVPLSAIDAWRKARSTKPSGADAGTVRASKARSADSDRELGPPTWWQRFRYNPWVFYPVTVISTLIILGGVVFALVSAGADFGVFSRQAKEWGLVREFRAEGKGETLIVIAQFSHPEGIADTAAYNEIHRAIENAAQELQLSTLRVVVSAVQISADARDKAEELGDRYNASIVIWGADTGVRVTVNFLNLKHPDFEASEVRISEKLRTQFANPSGYASFVTSDLPGQLSFLSLYAIGQSHFIQEAYGEARKMIEKGIAALAPGREPPVGLTEAYLDLGWLLRELGEWEQAVTNYTKLIELKPDYAVAYLNRGATLSSQGDLDRAILDFNQAIELDPLNSSAYSNRGAARILQDDIAAAIQDFDEAIKIDPQDAGIYVNRGTARSRRGDSAGAVEDFTKAIEMDPKDADAYYNRAIDRAVLGDLDGSIQDLNKAIEIDPQSADAYVNRAIARADKGDLEGAEQDFERAIGINPLLFEAYYNRAIFRSDQNDLAGAVQDLNKAVEIDPHSVAAYGNRGIARATQRDLAGAIEDFSEAIKIDPQSATAYHNRGMARWEQNDLVGATADFRRYLELSPDAPDHQQVEQMIAEFERQLNNP